MQIVAAPIKYPTLIIVNDGNITPSKEISHEYSDKNIMKMFEINIVEDAYHE
jgi:hypothetical protein